MDAEKHVVIIGGGFGGIAAARAFKRAPVRLTMIDRRNHHLFQPLLYQVATAALNPSDIASPIRRILRRQRNASVILGEASSIDTRRKIVQLLDGEVAYDYLIVASGATHSYFGHDEWLEPAPGLKTLEDAVEIRRRVLVAYEAAEREIDAAEVANWMTFVIIGGGPTGVEMAGALAEISRRVLERDFRKIDPGKARIVLIEAGPKVLPAMSPESSVSARRQLERLGVEVITDSPVTGVDDRGVTHGGMRLDSRTVIWAAGVAASPLGKALGAADVKLDRAGRVIVNQDLSVPGADDVFVIGDLASISSDGKLVPGLSPAAMQEGRHAAKNIVRLIRGEPTTAVSLPRQGDARDDWQGGRGRRYRGAASQRPRRMADVAIRAHFLSDRIPQPVHRDRRMGVDIPPQRSRRATDHGRRRATAGARRKIRESRADAVEVTCATQESLHPELGTRRPPPTRDEA